MFVELGNLIVLQTENKHTRNFIGVSESSTDGSFVVHHFLSYYLKNSTPVCFVAFCQSFGHYNAISQKFGNNLANLRDTNKLCFIEGLKQLGNMCCNDCDKGDNSTFSTYTQSQTVLKEILPSIRSKYKELKGSGCSPVIIIDNVSILISLGFSVTDVMAFCHYLQVLVNDENQEPGSLVLYTNNGREDNDEQFKLLWNWICHNASMTVEVAGLSTGYCKDVHGEISVKQRDCMVTNGKVRRMQYKLTDKNIALFASGMSSAVL